MRLITSLRITALAATLACLASPAMGQGSNSARADAHTWRLGLEGGIMMIRTPTQDATVLPSAGAHLHIMANRTALVLGIDEIFGTDVHSGLIRFNDARRYQAVLVAHPFNKRLEPYFGLGLGVMQVVGPRVASIVLDPDVRDELLSDARDASTNAFATGLFGLQGRWGRFTAFGQYQIGSAPEEGKLLRGITHSLHGGIRINLGSTKEEIATRRP